VSTKTDNVWIWEVTPLQTVSIHVVDEMGAPVTGARLVYWRKKGIAELARSAGQLPNEISIDMTSAGWLVATHPDWGEGGISWEAGWKPESGDRDLRIELRSPVLTHRGVPLRILDIRSLERMLEATVEHFGNKLVVVEIDNSEGRAIKNGLARGDRLVDAFRDRKGHVRIVLADGKELTFEAE
jgi:hypothetical protein